MRPAWHGTTLMGIQKRNEEGCSVGDQQHSFLNIVAAVEVMNGDRNQTVPDAVDMVTLCLPAIEYETVRVSIRTNAN
jgi:hypothetical protein